MIYANCGKTHHIYPAFEYCLSSISACATRPLTNFHRLQPYVKNIDPLTLDVVCCQLCPCECEEGGTGAGGQVSPHHLR